MRDGLNMSSPAIFAGLAWFSDPNAHAAQYNLVKTGHCKTLQWTIDSLDFRSIPQFDYDVLIGISDSSGLSGHGVHYSVFSVSGEPIRQKWLSYLKNDPLLAHYKRISVHFGFSTGGMIKDGAPLPVPLTSESLAIAHKNLDALASIAPCPIGIENLALAFSHDDVVRQGEFIDRLLTPFNGFLLLDLHNIYCQSCNFNIPIVDLVKTYPLGRVHEIHVSGGSWSKSADGKTIRRDTHDHSVPEDVFDALHQVITLCPNLNFVFLEQLPSALREESERQQYQKDYERLERIIRDHA